MSEIYNIFAGYERLCCQNFEKNRGEDSRSSEYLNFLVSYFELISILLSMILCFSFCWVHKWKEFFLFLSWPAGL